MSVSHIAYAPSSQTYVVYFVEKSPPQTDITAVLTALRRLTPLISTPVAGVSVSGHVISFRVSQGVSTQDALRAVTMRIEPSCTATALQLSLDCLGFSCGIHGAVAVAGTYAPGLEPADEHAFTTRLIAKLETIGLPSNLPRHSGETPIMIVSGIRHLCFGLGVFMQRLKLEWSRNFAACTICSKS